ncbi:hypothetical protein BX661DRAFT_171877 [Kickxella alabastrina]|uniref:uncharacterized protein n=1 Tax=Kickxella alabastrina TaxID=61397 RepID=UPI002221038F|nr:uncharacterized protein BX661DRAFT_171877 [Kickxella alabastrina]KAI7825920.1 hypothetical protein BX661DRAFT_171877 [Kickxella alabastrina]KAJ1947190.1 hypothetical protein GGF37_000645 [Kickxella alabastrina]
MSESSHLYAPQPLQRIHIEYPELAQFSSNESAPRRPGVSYTPVTVLLPSDRRLIMIPASFHIPPNGCILVDVSNPDNEEVADTPENNSVRSRSASNASSADMVVESEINTDMSNGCTDWTLNSHSNFMQFSDILSSSTAPSHDSSQAINSYFSMGSAFGQQQQHLTAAEEFTKVQNTKDHDSFTDDFAGSSNLTNLSVADLSILPTQMNIEKSTQLLKRIREEDSQAELLKPKKPQNAFFRFRRQFHMECMATGKKHMAKDISEMASKVWRSMTEAQKDYYKQLADEEMGEYQVKKDTYKEATKKGRKRTKKTLKSPPTSAAALATSDNSNISPVCHPDSTSKAITAYQHARNSHNNTAAALTFATAAGIPLDMGSSVSSSHIPLHIPNITSSNYDWTQAILGGPSISLMDTDGPSMQSNPALQSSTPASGADNQIDYLTDQNQPVRPQPGQLSSANSYFSNSHPANSGISAPTRTPNNLTGVLPSIPDIAVVDPESEDNIHTLQYF